MRLFTAIDIPSDLRARFGELLARLRPLARFRWSPVENLHITTKFIGEWPDGRLGELDRALASVQAPAVDMQLRGFGWFPNPHHPRSLFAAVHAPETLPALARATNDACETLGIERETKRFTPHLTLARIQDEAGLSEVRRAIAALSSGEFGTFRAETFGLYSSEMGRYTLLKEFKLQ